MKNAIPAVLLFVGFWLYFSGTEPKPEPTPVDPIPVEPITPVPEPEPVEPDPIPNPVTNLILEADASYWAGYAELCDDMAGEYPDGWNTTAVDLWNRSVKILRDKTHGAINTMLGEAAEAGKLREFAEQIRGDK